MKSNVLPKQLMSVVKQECKQRGITQSYLSNRLEVSLPTIKRWMRGEGVTLESLGALCSELGLSLGDITARLQEENKQCFTYTEAQEAFFSKNPDHLAFFDNLLRGKSPMQIQKKFNLKPQAVTKYLLKLDKLKLLELGSDNKFKLKVLGEPSWKPGGALSQTLRPQIVNEFLSSCSKNQSSLYLHDYTEEDSLKIRTKIDELVLLSREANKRATYSTAKSTAFGFFYGLKPFRWSLDRYLNN